MKKLLKASIEHWTHFCIFTYDSNIHDESSFFRRLENSLRYLERSRGWGVCGIWRRSSVGNRLAFHALVHIPQDGMVGNLEKSRIFYKHLNRTFTIYENTWFRKWFGRNSFNVLTEQDYSKMFSFYGIEGR